MNYGDDRTHRRHADAYALFEDLRALLDRLPDGHPSRPGLHAAAVAAYCHWRESMVVPSPEVAMPPPGAQTRFLGLRRRR